MSEKKLKKEAEAQKKRELYDPYPNCEENEEEDLCDYTGDQCIGNKLFCEECDVFREEGESQ